MDHQHVEDNVQHTYLEHLGRGLDLGQEELERVEGHSLEMDVEHRTERDKQKAYAGNETTQAEAYKSLFAEYEIFARDGRYDQFT